LNLSFWLYSAKSTSYKVPHYAVSLTYCHIVSLMSNYSPQNPDLKHPQSMFLS
jgi:hypothetical protein